MAQSIGANVLAGLKQAGVESTILECRQRYAVAAQVLNHYIRPMTWCQCGHPWEQHGEEACGVWLTNCQAKDCWCAYWSRRERVYPHYLPTQASGRWSTTNPPLTNFPEKIHGVIKPDPGTYWLYHDMDAIEGRISAALTEDEEDLEAFRLGLDIHTMTACRMHKLPLPPDCTNPHTLEVNQGWRERVAWRGKEDRRRHLAKTARYGLLYGPDENAILQAKGVEELGLTREELLHAARQYLDAKPKLTQAKRAFWDQVLKQPEVRTVFGRRLRVYPTGDEAQRWVRSRRTRPGDAQKVAWNFVHQGFVADYMNESLIRITTRWPQCWLVKHGHDALTMGFPMEVDPWPAIREEVERTVTFANGVDMTFTTGFVRIMSDGRKEAL